MDYYNYVDLTKLDLRDNIGSFGSGGAEHFMYHVRAGPARPYDFPDNIHTSITYELNRDLKVIRRKVYGIGDFLGDLGGLYGALTGLFGALIIIFQFKAYISYVSDETYLIRDGDELEINGGVSIAPEQREKYWTMHGETLKKRIPINFFGSIKLSF